MESRNGKKIKAGPVTWISVALMIVGGSILGANHAPWWTVAILVIGLAGSSLLWEFAQAKKNASRS